MSDGWLDFWNDLSALLKHLVAVVAVVFVDVGTYVVVLWLNSRVQKFPPRLVETVERFTHWAVVPALAIFSLECILFLILNSFEALSQRVHEIRLRRLRRKDELKRTEAGLSAEVAPRQTHE